MQCVEEMFDGILTLREICWQSPDQLVNLGMADIEGVEVVYSWLGDRFMRHEDVAGLQVQFASLMQKLSEKSGSLPPLLLLSNCPGFDPQTIMPETAFKAGAYRNAQQQWRDTGAKLISVALGQLVGGTYLMHGLSAPVRLGIKGLSITGGLPRSQAEQYLKADEIEWHPMDAQTPENAVQMGLLTTIVPKSRLKSTLMAHLSLTCR